MREMGLVLRFWGRKKWVGLVVLGNTRFIVMRMLDWARTYDYCWLELVC